MNDRAIQDAMKSVFQGIGASMTEDNVVLFPGRLPFIPDVRLERAKKVQLFCAACAMTFVSMVICTSSVSLAADRLLMPMAVVGLVGSGVIGTLADRRVRALDSGRADPKRN